MQDDKIEIDLLISLAATAAKGFRNAIISSGTVAQPVEHRDAVLIHRLRVQKNIY